MLINRVKDHFALKQQKLVIYMIQLIKQFNNVADDFAHVCFSEIFLWKHFGIEIYRETDSQRKLSSSEYLSA